MTPAKPKNLKKALLAIVEGPPERTLDTDVYTLTVLQGGHKYEFKVNHHTPDDPLIAFIMCCDCMSKDCDHALEVAKHVGLTK